MSNVPGTFDPVERAKEKQASRNKDAADLAAGLKTQEQLLASNAKFAFPDAIVDFSTCKRLY
jgi:16S rRNA C967 or C1407 C5-methylase (RsmB/RsmF family)